MIFNLLSWGTWGAPCRRLIHSPPWRRQKPWLTKGGCLVEQLFHRKSKSSSGTKPCLCAYHSLAGCKGVNWKRYDSVWLCMTPPLNPTCKITASQEHVHRLMLGWPICAWIANSNSSISKLVATSSYQIKNPVLILLLTSFTTRHLSLVQGKQ